MWAGCRRVPAEWGDAEGEVSAACGWSSSASLPGARGKAGMDVWPWPGRPNLPGAGSLAGGEEMPA